MIKTVLMDTYIYMYSFMGWFFLLLSKIKNRELFSPDGFYQNVNNHLIINRLSFLQVFQCLGSKLGFGSWLLKKKYKNFYQMDLKLIEWIASLFTSF